MEPVPPCIPGRLRVLLTDKVNELPLLLSLQCTGQAPRYQMSFK